MSIEPPAKLWMWIAGKIFSSPGTEGKREGQRSSPAPKQDRLASGTSLLGRLLFFGHLGAVGCAATLALAGVLAFAAVVAGLATALALARVLAFTGVLFLHLLVVGLLVLARVLILRAERRLQRGKQGRSLDCCTGPGDQSCERRTGEQCLCRLCHVKSLLSIRLRNETPSERSLRLVDRESPCPLRLNRLFSAISRRLGAPGQERPVH